MKTRVLGAMTVSAIGLGGTPMSIEGRPERSRAIATIHAALGAGITLIDTADAYHVGVDEVGHNETLIAEALSSYGGDTSNVLVATKGGSSATGRWLADDRQFARAPEGGARRVAGTSGGRGDRPVPAAPSRCVGRCVRGVRGRDLRPAGCGEVQDNWRLKVNQGRLSR